MVAAPAPLAEPHPAGFPAAFTVGDAVNLRLFIAGRPHFKERPRARVLYPRGGGRPQPQIYTAAATRNWEDRVAMLAKAQIGAIEVDGEDFTVPLAGRILMVIRFNLPKPPSYPRRVVYPLKKPDDDNLSKALVDGLVKGRILLDDSRITDKYSMKRYAEPGHPEGVEVDITSYPVEEV
jgi:Holliday junction resolvase RusA-like endonuclease